MPDIPATPDWGSLLDSAAQTAGKPLQATPEAFAAQYGPAADSVASKTGIDSNTILGQWGLETGWGKSVIPGTNNLGNIKAPKGQGVQATDNMTGSKDGYLAFPDANSFADHYAGLLQSKYGAALNTGTDAQATASALKKGGYAEDPNYVSKMTAAAAMAAKARGGGTNWGALLDSMGTSSPQNDANAGAGDPASSVQQTLQQYPGFQNTPDSGSAIGGFAGGVGEGFGKTVLGAQALVGKGLQAIGADTAGNALVNDAQTGAANLTQQAADAAGSHNIARAAGNMTGAVAPALAVGPELLPQIGLGATYGADDAALNNKDILPATVEGAGIGAGGAVAGKLLGAGATALAPVAKRIGSTLSGGQDAAVANIAGKLGDTLDPTIANLAANSNEIIPGSLPTAAEAANNPVITRMQRAAQNTEAGQEAFPARQAANTDARLNAGDAVVGPDIDAESQQFMAQQQARVQAGQAELPPINDAQSALMQTPTYIKAINVAKRDAANSGATAFDDAGNALQTGIRDDLTAVTGTPQDLEQARLARSNEARENYGAIDGQVPITADIASRPNVRSAIAEAATNDQSRLGQAAPQGITTIKPKVAPIVDEAGNTTGFKTVAPGQQLASAQTLVGAKGILSDAAASASRAGEANKSDIARQAMSALDSYLEENVPAYRAANDAYRNASVPIDQMTALQKRLVSAVDPTTGEVNPTTLKNALASIQKEQLKPGLQQADRITDQQIAQLQAVAQRAADSTNNITGVSGQGQEFIRKALAENAARTTGSLDAEQAQRAKAAFDNYLATHSPNYRAYQAAQAGAGADLASRQALADALAKMTNVANDGSGTTALTFTGAKGALKGKPLTGAAQEYATNLLDDLQRSTTANAKLGAAGSNTVSDSHLAAGGLLAHLAGGHAASGALGGLAVAGHAPAAAIGYIMKRALSQASAKTDKATIDLLLNPKKLATALQEFKDQPKAKALFIKTLKQKASGAGKAGTQAVQAYNARNS